MNKISSFKKIIILYSSGYGTTKEIAEEIARVLSKDTNYRINLQSIDDVSDIGNYNVVIVGTSVRAERPLANVRDFFVRYHQELKEKAWALFIVCLTAATQKGQEKVMREYAPQIIEKFSDMKPFHVAAFAGKIDFDKLNPVMQLLIGHVYRKTGIKARGSVDKRDWKSIRRWAEEVGERIRRLPS